LSRANKRALRFRPKPGPTCEKARHASGQAVVLSAHFLGCCSSPPSWVIRMRCRTPLGRPTTHASIVFLTPIVFLVPIARPLLPLSTPFPFLAGAPTCRRRPCHRHPRSMAPSAAIQPLPPSVLHRPRSPSNPSALSNSGEFARPPPQTLTLDRCRRAPPNPKTLHPHPKYTGLLCRLRGFVALPLRWPPAQPLPDHHLHRRPSSPMPFSFFPIQLNGSAHIYLGVCGAGSVKGICPRGNNKVVIIIFHVYDKCLFLMLELY
jgi:hypothetical protein